MRRVLVVDGHPDTRYLLKLKLSINFDVEVIEASNGRELMKVVESQQCDLVISELFMANENGLWIHDWLKEKHPSLPMILFTGMPEHAQPVDLILRKVVEKPQFDKLMKVAQEIGHLDASK